MVVGEEEKIMNMGGPLRIALLSILMVMAIIAAHGFLENVKDAMYYVNIINEYDPTVALALKAIFNASLFFALLLFAIVMTKGE